LPLYYKNSLKSRKKILNEINSLKGTSSAGITKEFSGTIEFFQGKISKDLSI